MFKQQDGEVVVVLARINIRRAFTGVEVCGSRLHVLECVLSEPQL
jgi:hypothetical protein